MKAEQIFSIANSLALLSWLVLIIAPRWSPTRKIIRSGAVPLLLSAAYLILIVLFFGAAEGGFGSLPEVMRLFTNEWAALAGWIHYLAFDLLVGIWEVRDAEERGISHWFVIPCLVLTFLLGPIGFLLYFALRFFTAKKEVVNDSGII
ncbi:MAG TPA: ABA4-like family protein [Pyrinomonadaceae bacterium]|jgi:prepilin signal peptidase PulO-like enzyme (type II secretory pathway)